MRDVEFGVGDNFRATWKGEKVRRVKVEGQDTRCWSVDLVVGDGAMGWNQGVLGAFFVVFDYEGKRVGFANKST
jgi:predicted phage tail protein